MMNTEEPFYQGQRQPNLAGIQDLLIEQLGMEAEKIVPTARLVEDLGADSLDLVEIVMFCEEDYAIDVREEEAEKLITVQDLLDCVNRNLESCFIGGRYTSSDCHEKPTEPQP